MARTALQALLDVADTAARSISTAVVMHRASQLRISEFLRVVQNAIKVFPFDNHSLFSETSFPSGETVQK